jgi:hypothetical protein
MFIFAKRIQVQVELDIHVDESFVLGISGSGTA